MFLWQNCFGFWAECWITQPPGVPSNLCSPWFSDRHSTANHTAHMHRSNSDTVNTHTWWWLLSKSTYIRTLVFKFPKWCPAFPPILTLPPYKVLVKPSYSALLCTYKDLGFLLLRISWNSPRESSGRALSRWHPFSLEEVMVSTWMW